MQQPFHNIVLLTQTRFTCIAFCRVGHDGACDGAFLDFPDETGVEDLGFGAGCGLSALVSAGIEPVPARHENTPRQQIADGDPQQVVTHPGEAYCLGMLTQQGDGEQGHVGHGMLEAAGDEGEQAPENHDAFRSIVTRSCRHP